MAARSSTTSVATVWLCVPAPASAVQATIRLCSANCAALSCLLLFYFLSLYAVFFCRTDQRLAIVGEKKRQRVSEQRQELRRHQLRPSHPSSDRWIERDGCSQLLLLFLCHCCILIQQLQCHLRTVVDHSPSVMSTGFYQFDNVLNCVWVHQCASLWLLSARPTSKCTLLWMHSTEHTQQIQFTERRRVITETDDICAISQSDDRPHSCALLIRERERERVIGCLEQNNEWRDISGSRGDKQTTATKERAFLNCSSSTLVVHLTTVTRTALWLAATLNAKSLSWCLSSSWQLPCWCSSVLRCHRSPCAVAKHCTVLKHCKWGNAMVVKEQLYSGLVHCSKLCTVMMVISGLGGGSAAGRNRWGASVCACVCVSMCLACSLCLRLSSSQSSCRVF